MKELHTNQDFPFVGDVVGKTRNPGQVATAFELTREMELNKTVHIILLFEGTLHLLN